MSSKKGRSIQCPGGPPESKKRKIKLIPGSAQLLADIEATDTSAFKDRTDKLARALRNLQSGPTPVDAGGPMPVEVPVGVAAERSDSGSDNEDEDVNNFGDNYINNFLPHNDLHEEPPPVNATFVQYIKGSYYKLKQLKESANWLKVLPEMFLSYMNCSQPTSQWGDNSAWSIDRNTPCSCGPGDQRTRKVDIVDIVERKQVDIPFCTCTCDQVRLIRMGYIGGSPIHPEAAYLIRLLRLHHHLWKYCTVRTQGFTIALDEYLDAYNGLILVNQTNEPRLWRRTFSLAVDAYRHMLRLEEELAIRALLLSSLQVLAQICPRCFGPLQPNEEPYECDYVVCCDGNFQHRRHKAASKEYDEKEVVMPPLFMHPKDVEKWNPGLSKKDQEKEMMERCTSQHTAAADHRGASTWKGGDETGLIGMACRHDHMLTFVNVVQSGERQYYVLAMIDQLIKKTAETGKPNKSIQVLYDIGCTLEKSIMKNKVFKDECDRRQLRFGTSAFHAFVHQWSCQLLYNPRLNKGWGLSDGEGLERVWSALSPLISPNRYATTQHRLDSLNLKASHQNKILRRNAVRSTTMKLRNAEKTYDTALKTLKRLESVSANYTIGYFSIEWEKQQTSQLAAMAHDGVQKLEEQLNDLLDFEDELTDAQKKMTRLWKKNRSNLTQAERDELLRLPSSIVALDTAIQGVIQQLGSPEFRNLKDARTPKARVLIHIRLAKMKLYEAKVGIMVAQERWDRGGWGTKNQQGLKKLMTKRQLLFKRKWTSFKGQVDRYNEMTRDNQLPCPSLDEAKKMNFDDCFWSVGPLSHPSEKWAVDAGTKEGIAAFLKYRSCNEELRRIGRETRQMVHSALEIEAKLDELSARCDTEWDAETRGKDLIDLVAPGQRISKDVWKVNVGVLKALHNNLRQHHCRTWMVWDAEIPGLLRRTVKYTRSTVQETEELINRWNRLMARGRKTWEQIVKVKSVQATALDDLELVEQNMLFADEGEEDGGQPIDNSDVDDDEDNSEEDEM